MTVSARPVAIARALLGELAQVDAPLGRLTTYRVGGSAALLARADREEDLTQIAAAVGESGIAVLVVGNGSNLLVADAGFGGLAVMLGDGFAQIDVTGSEVRAGGAASLPVVARRTAAAGLRGFEWAVGVPGTIGGAVRMNAGGHGSDLSASLVGVRVIDLATGDDVRMASPELDLAYRHSNLRASQVVVEAELALVPGERSAAEAEVSEVVRWRREHQPGGPNAGSVFTNPPGDSAGRLIEACGAKGLRVGTAEVSTKHANFIQADEGGRANDVLALMSLVRDRVAAASGVVLEPETRLVGFPGGQTALGTASAPPANPGLQVEGS